MPSSSKDELAWLLLRREVKPQSDDNAREPLLERRRQTDLSSVKLVQQEAVDWRAAESASARCPSHNHHFCTRDHIRFLKLHKESCSTKSVSSLTKCHHHRTKTKFQVEAGSRQDIAYNLTSTSSNRLNCTNINLTTTRTTTTTTTTTSTSTSTSQLALARLNLYSLPPRWLLTALIYIVSMLIQLNSNSSSGKMIAQAAGTALAPPSTPTTNYWPLVHQSKYQQLFFTGRTQQDFDDINSNSNSNSNNKKKDAATGSGAESTSDQVFSAPLHQHSAQRRLLGSLRHTQQQTAAIAAAAAALAATANAALARKSQSHNLMIGQNFNNFSAIIPYSIAHDVDYATMQEDQIINEPMSDMHGSNYQEDQQQQQQQQQLVVAAGGGNQEIKLSDSTDDSEQPGLLQQPATTLLTASSPHRHQHQLQHHHSFDTNTNTNAKGTKIEAKVTASDRALLSLDTNRLMLPQMQQIKARFNQGCVGGTKCQFFAFCWMSGGSLGASCGLLMTCCVTPSRQEIQPGFYGPVVNDPYCGRSTSKINRIVGGTDASFGQFPWQAFVQVGGSRCGGALISSRHVVTAGHCVARSQHSPSSIKITLGDYILNSDIESIPHEVYSVVEVLLHPNFRFTPQADRYDVAVLELDRAASYKDNIKPICLPQKDATFVGRVAYVAGWGALQAGSKLRPKVLQHVAVPVIENNVCESWHRRKGIDIRIYDEMMCAGYEMGQRDACQGDSGGPLMLNQFGVWYLVGIVSAGYSCAKQYQPGIYHRVSSSSDWISSNVYQQGGNSK